MLEMHHAVLSACATCLNRQGNGNATGARSRATNKNGGERARGHMHGYTSVTGMGSIEGA